MCVCVRVFSCLVSSPYRVVTDFLFLALIPPHSYIAFCTPTADFTIFITSNWNQSSSLCFVQAAFFLWLSCVFCHRTPSHCFSDRGLQLGMTFQPISQMCCYELLWELSKKEPSCTADVKMAILEFKVLSSWKGVVWQCKLVPQHHGPPLQQPLLSCWHSWLW